MKKEIPILMSSPMVQAIIEGCKTMTRRIVEPQPEVYGCSAKWKRYISKAPKEWSDQLHLTTFLSDKSPYGKPGDILWVRESFNVEQYPVAPEGDHDELLYYYRATENKYPDMKWRPSTHMPKVAARIWLEVTDVRIQRLQDISEQDAIAEGIMFYIDEHWKRPRYKDYLADASGYGHPDHDYPTVGIAVTSFSTLWCKINGEKSWYLNPWVWVLSFNVLSTTGKPGTHSQSATIRKFERMIGGKTSL
jgi:hypothetical protein